MALTPTKWNQYSPHLSFKQDPADNAEAHVTAVVEVDSAGDPVLFRRYTRVDQVVYGGAVYTITHAFKNITTIANTLIIAAPASGLKLFIMDLFVSNNGTSARQVQFESNTTAIACLVTAAASGGGGNFDPGFECADGQALNANLDAVGVIGIQVSYITVTV